MTPYMAILFSSYVLTSCARNYRISSQLQRAIWAGVVLILALFAGLRDDDVGSDTIAYVNRFLYLVDIKQNWDTYGSAAPGYKIILAISRFISNDPIVLLFVTSAIASTLYITALNRTTNASPLAIYTFIAFGFFVFHMNGLRQGLALGIFMHSIPFIPSGRPIKYAALVLIASTFHISAIFALPLYAIFRMGFSLRYFTIAAAVLFIFVNQGEIIFQIGSLANERYSDYSLRAETGGAYLALAYSLLMAIFFLGRSVISRETKRTYDIYLSIYVFGCAIFAGVVIGGHYVEITRMAVYFLVTLSMLTPLLVRSLPGVRLRSSAALAFIGIGALFFYIYLSNIGGLTPYAIRGTTL